MVRKKNSFFVFAVVELIAVIIIGACISQKELIIESDKIWIEENRDKRLILDIKNLPQESLIARGLELGRDSFSNAILSPSGSFVAFSVDGIHGWSGLYDLNENKITETAFFFEGKVTQLSFSPNSRHLAIEYKGAGGFLSISFWNVGMNKTLNCSPPKSSTGFPLEIRIEEWVDNGLKILMKSVEEEKWQLWLLDIQNDQISLKKF